MHHRYLFLSRLGIGVNLLQQKYTIQRILHGRIGSTRPTRDPHDNILGRVLQKDFRDDLPLDRSVGDGVVGADARGLINVEGSYVFLVGYLQEMGRVGRVPSAHDEYEVEVEFVLVFD